MTPQRSRPVKPRPRALVTGGAVRIGRAVALALATNGMDVAIGYRSAAAAAARTVEDLAASGARAVALRADLTDPRAAARLVGRARRALGGLDVLVNNAAVFFRTPLGQVTPRDWNAHLDVNLRGTFFTCQAAAQLMESGGRIVNIADVGAVEAWPSYLPYVASKAGVVALTRGLARVLRARGIAVNCVLPGAVLRPARMPRARWLAAGGERHGTVADVVSAVTYFATCPAAVTGQALHVAGGLP